MQRKNKWTPISFSIKILRKSKCQVSLAIKYIICTIDECGETFYGRHTAQHPAAVIRNDNKKFRSFKSKENIHKKEVGPYHGFGY